MRAKGVPDPVVEAAHVKSMLTAFPHLEGADLGRLVVSRDGLERIMRDMVLALAAPSRRTHRVIKDEEKGRRVLRALMQDIERYPLTMTADPSRRLATDQDVR